MKIKRLILFLVCLLTLTGGAAYGERPQKRFDATTNTCRIFTFKSMREGARVFKRVCLACHNEEYDNGLRGMLVLYPRAFSPGAWNRIFFEKYPKCANDGSWKSISSQDILKLNDYLYRGGKGTWEDYTKFEFC